MNEVNDYCNELCIYSTSLDSFSKYEIENITRVNILILGLVNIITLIYIVVMVLEISRITTDVKMFLVDKSFYLVKNKINSIDDDSIDDDSIDDDSIDDDSIDDDSIDEDSIDEDSIENVDINIKNKLSNSDEYFMRNVSWTEVIY